MNIFNGNFYKLRHFDNHETIWDIQADLIANTLLNFILIIWYTQTDIIANILFYFIIRNWLIADLFIVFVLPAVLCGTSFGVGLHMRRAPREIILDKIMLTKISIVFLYSVRFFFLDFTDEG